MGDTNVTYTYMSTVPVNRTTLSPEELKKSFTVVAVVFGTMILTSSIVTIIVIACRRKQYPKSLPSFSYIIWRILPNITHSNRHHSNSNASLVSSLSLDHQNRDLERGDMTWAWRSSNPVNTEWITLSDEARLIQENTYNSRRWFRLENSALYKGGSSQYPSTSFIETSSTNNKNNKTSTYNDKTSDNNLPYPKNDDNRTRAESIGTLIISAPKWLRRKIFERYRCNIDHGDITSLVVINPAVLSPQPASLISSHREGYQNIDDNPQTSSNDTVITNIHH